MKISIQPNIMQYMKFFGMLMFLTFVLSSSAQENTLTSQLSSGDIYKISVSEQGIYKIDYDLLKELGINVSNINPKKIKLLGNGGGMLPEANAAERIDDLVEHAIFLQGESDGSFDKSDFILFYAEGADQTVFNEGKQTFYTQKNIYETQNYYYIKISEENGLRIQSQNSIANTDYTTTQFDDFKHIEKNELNLLHDYVYASGSGKEWFGDKFDLTKERNYNFSFPDIITNIPAKLEVAMATRKHGTTGALGYFYAILNGQETFKSTGMRTVNTFDTEVQYARKGSIYQAFTPSSSSIDVAIRYNEAGGTAWLDYITINARRQLRFRNTPLIFRDIKTLEHDNSTFQLVGIPPSIEVWNISNTTSPTLQQGTLNGTQFSFGAATHELQTFIAFNKNDSFLKPKAIGQIENQNLHGIEKADVLIVYHKDFETAAQTLAAHRSQHSGFLVEIVEIGQIYNEFSSGKKDPTALRDFVRMVYLRYPQLNYLVLLGDGSFDPRNIYQIETKSDFIPVYETQESLAPIYAYPSDDFYALLDKREGSNLTGALDIAVGRIPVTTAENANAIVQKIIKYDSSPHSLGEWRNRLTYVADDQDNNTHINQADGIATYVDTTYKNININKIYFDAFRQESSAGGNTYPEAKSSITDAVFKGQLIVNYLGHGSATSWAQERVLQETDINNWQNSNYFPLFVTATCSFTPYDDPSKVSAGEKVLLKEDGGGIGLFTTVRAVLSFSNERLTRAVFKHIFKKVDGEYPPLGEIMRTAKNSNASDTLTSNARKFTMIGDPSMHLALPQYHVTTSSINGQTNRDTLSALEQVTIQGFISDNNNQKITNFNGEVFVTVYDKPQEVKTLANDSDSRVKSFYAQKNVLFKGKASVKNGDFTIKFVVPKDIDYNYGLGRISYYASNGKNLDAAGVYENIIIGGTAPNAVKDDTPPNIQVFMGDEEFAFGGITDSNPILFIKLSDDFGINVAGTGLGHDLTATLDNNTQKVIVLNDFYESETDNFKKGYVKYPLKDVETGRHFVHVKGWDIANNSGEGYTEFVVANDEATVIQQLLNYPNPFTTQTEFQFEHNLPEQMLKVQVKIYTVAGNLVKTLYKDVITTGNRVTGIEWDGKDDYGDKLGRGVYLYKVTIGKSSDSSIEKTISSSFQKLVILK